MEQISQIIGEKEVICPRCGFNQSNVRIMLSNGDEFGECKKCGKMTYIDFSNKGSSNKTMVKCPYCNSQNTIKISNSSKIGKVALFGIFAIGKTTKEWHCNDCKSDF